MGFFSWITQDTNRSISNSYSSEPTFPVYMTDNKGNVYKEENYEGYGEFGGKDYFLLLAEMNIENPQYHNRDNGIDLQYKGGYNSDSGFVYVDKVIYPSLTEYRGYMDGEQPENCPNQGYFYPDYSE